MTNFMFIIPCQYEDLLLAEYLGGVLGLRFVANRRGDIVHGSISQSRQGSNMIVSVEFYGYDEDPNFNEITKQGHLSRIRAHVGTFEDYEKINNALLDLVAGRVVLK